MIANFFGLLIVFAMRSSLTVPRPVRFCTNDSCQMAHWPTISQIEIAEHGDPVDISELED